MTALSPTRSLPPARPLHVLQVIDHPLDAEAATAVLQLADHLPKPRLRLSALCKAESALTVALRKRGIEVQTTAMTDDPRWTAIQFVARRIVDAGVDLLHAHGPHAHLMAGLAGRLTSTPVLASIHGELTPLDIEVHRAMGSRISVPCRQTYFEAQALGIDARRLSCDPPGVDPRAFQPHQDGEGRLRRSLGLDAEMPLVGFVGPLVPEAGSDTFARAVQMLCETLPGVHAVIAGDGPMADDLLAWFAHHGLADRLHFVDAGCERGPLYCGLDLLLWTARGGMPWPRVLIEAMACGVPVVASRLGGVTDLVVPGQTGWLAEPDDPEELASLAVPILADPRLARRIGQRARFRAVARYGLDEAISRMAQLLTRLAGAQRVPATARVAEAVA